MLPVDEKTPFSEPEIQSSCGSQKWEADFYTPPVLGGAALLPFSAPAVYKNPLP